MVCMHVQVLKPTVGDLHRRAFAQQPIDHVKSGTWAGNLRDVAEDRDRLLVGPIVQDELQHENVAGSEFLRQRCEKIDRHGCPSVAQASGLQEGGAAIHDRTLVCDPPARVRELLQDLGEQVPLATADVANSGVRSGWLPIPEQWRHLQRRQRRHHCIKALLRLAMMLMPCEVLLAKCLDKATTATRHRGEASAAKRVPRFLVHVQCKVPHAARHSSQQLACRCQSEAQLRRAQHAAILGCHSQEAESRARAHVAAEDVGVEFPERICDDRARCEARRCRGAALGGVDGGGGGGRLDRVEDAPLGECVQHLRLPICRAEHRYVKSWRQQRSRLDQDVSHHASERVHGPRRDVICRVTFNPRGLAKDVWCRAKKVPNSHCRKQHGQRDTRPETHQCNYWRGCFERWRTTH
mmetsp:Transcript_100003/g.268598  ORF Transcript_100003/g.268598 Transcript_100003/m.268598 type:complete len:409 (-) Transcript_100003:4-1230(-)